MPPAMVKCTFLRIQAFAESVAPVRGTARRFVRCMRNWLRHWGRPVHLLAETVRMRSVLLTN